MRQFPTLPTNKYDWLSVAWEPIALSGERVTVFIVINEVGKETSPQTHRCVTLQQAKCLLGENSSSIISLLDFAESFLAEQLKDAVQFEDIRGLSGFSVGRRGYLYARSISEATTVAVREASLFGSAALANFSENLLLKIDEQSENINSQSEDKFFQLVYKNVLAQRPNFESKFRKTFKFTDSARGTKIDFAGNNLVANLHRLKPGRTLSQQVKFGKQKLLDLSNLRLWLAENNALIEHELHHNFELLTHRPHSDSVDYSSSEIKQVNEAVEELVYSADHHELLVREFINADDAAMRIIAAEN
jgi:hypothetical protein